MCVLFCLVWQQPTIDLEGHPLRLLWHDLNGDERLDLVALMVRSQSVGEIDAFFAQGDLIGNYSETTFKDRYLQVYIQSDEGWIPRPSVSFDQDPVYAIYADKSQPGMIWIWLNDGLQSWTWAGDHWDQVLIHPTPQLQSPVPLASYELPLLVPSPSGPQWLIPDLEGIHMVGTDHRFLSYPAHSVDTSGSMNQAAQSITITLPRLLQVDADPYPDLVFRSRSHHSVFRLSDLNETEIESEGTLFDLNSDGLADRIEVEEVDNVDGPRDLPKMKSIIRAYLADGPLSFPNEPNVEQEVPGIVFSTEDMPLKITDPFFDINNDGLMDLAGIALKLSFFQIAKVMTLGRMKITFLMHLSIQLENGRFHTLAGGPFEMVWKLNLRNLSMPDFGQITADFDGDGWLDIFTVDDKKVTVVPVTMSGLQTKGSYSAKIDKSLRDPDVYIGKDLNADGRSELILAVFSDSHTRIGVMEVSP